MSNLFQSAYQAVSRLFSNETKEVKQFPALLDDIQTELSKYFPYVLVKLEIMPHMPYNMDWDLTNHIGMGSIVRVKELNTLPLTEIVKDDRNSSKAASPLMNHVTIKAGSKDHQITRNVYGADHWMWHRIADTDNKHKFLLSNASPFQQHFTSLYELESVTEYGTGEIVPCSTSRVVECIMATGFTGPTGPTGPTNINYYYNYPAWSTGPTGCVGP